MPNIVQTPQDEVAWDRAKDIVAKQYGDGLKKSNPERFYSLTTAIFKQVRRGLRKYEDHPTDADLIRALLTVKTLVECTYTDYGWTKFLRDADDAMWDKVLAPLRSGKTPWGVTEGGYLHSHGSYDAELERFHTHDDLISHMTHLFSGQPHTDKRGATVQITSRAQALAARDDLTGGDPMATNDARKAADDYFAKRGEKSKRLTYLPGPVHAHITQVIDKHFPA
jgi:hypothetical protein